jgi:hypothetical protein
MVTGSYDEYPNYSFGSGSHYVIRGLGDINWSHNIISPRKGRNQLPFMKCEYCDSRIPIKDWTCNKCGAPTPESHFVGGGRLVRA